MIRFPLFPKPLAFIAYVRMCKYIHILAVEPSKHILVKRAQRRAVVIENFIQAGNFVNIGCHSAYIMRHHDNCKSESHLKSLKEMIKILLPHNIYACARLVKYEYFRIARERPCNRNAL